MAVEKSTWPELVKSAISYLLLTNRMRWTPGTPLKLYEVRKIIYVNIALGTFIMQSPGNQTWDDRANEAQVVFQSK